MNKDKILTFRKGTCACEGISTSQNARVVKKHHVQKLSHHGASSRMNRSIKSRFLK